MDSIEKEITAAQVDIKNLYKITDRHQVALDNSGQAIIGVNENVLKELAKMRDDFNACFNKTLPLWATYMMMGLSGAAGSMLTIIIMLLNYKGVI